MNGATLRLGLWKATERDRRVIESYLWNTPHELAEHDEETNVDVILFAVTDTDDQVLDRFRHAFQAAPRLPWVLLTLNESELVAACAVQCGAQDCLPINSLTYCSFWRSIRCAYERHQYRTHVSSPDIAAEHAVASLRTMPVWDPDKRELRLRDDVVKRFRQPSRNQELVLAAFQEDGWPSRIDDPLPMEIDRDPKERLQATIKSLNRHQIEKQIRFSGDGTGQAILWKCSECKLR
ncbi:MAG: hypothetical protein AAFX06_19530 [Planctomycetota bacterium]